VTRDVGLADDPDEIVTVDDGQPTDLVLLHHGQGFVDRVVSADRDRLAAG
jgi:hypothetical protein